MKSQNRGLPNIGERSSNIGKQSTTRGAQNCKGVPAEQAAVMLDGVFFMWQKLLEAGLRNSCEDWAAQLVLDGSQPLISFFTGIHKKTALPEEKTEDTSGEPLPKLGHNVCFSVLPLLLATSKPLNAEPIELRLLCWAADVSEIHDIAAGV